MNDIDFTVIQTVTRFYRQEQQLPRLCLVHPSWFTRLTIDRVYVYIPRHPRPPLPAPSDALPAADPDAPVAISVTDRAGIVPIQQLSLRSLPREMRYHLPQQQWVLCLTRKDILMGLELFPDRSLSDHGICMADLMEMSEDERYWLQHKQAREQIEREY